MSEGEVEKRLCMDDVHESFSSVGGSDPAFDGTTILEPESISQLHSTILDSADSASLDGVDQQVNQQEGMPVKDSLKEALKDPSVVRVLTNAINSSIMGEIRTQREAPEGKEEKIAELQDLVDWLGQYSRRNNVWISGIPESTGDAENTDACLLYTSPSPRDMTISRMPSSA